MNKSAGKLSIILLILLGLAGCSKTALIQNVENERVSNSIEKHQVRSAIIEAASKRGWVVTERDENTIRATLNVRSHKAVVSIPYSADNFSIRYVDSENLNKHNNRIHRNFNRWINTLRSDVNGLLQIEQFSK